MTGVDDATINNGILSLSGGSFSVNNNTTLEGSGAVQFSSGTFNSGSLSIQSASAVFIQGSTAATTISGATTLSNGGNLWLTNGSTFDTASLTLENTGGSAVFNAGTFTVSGATTLSGASSAVILDGASFETQSLSSVTAGSSFTNNSGTLHLNGGNWDFENTADWTIEADNDSDTSTVEYTNATVDHSNFDLTIGDTRAGGLTLNAGASLRADHVYLGSGDGGSAALTIKSDYTSTPYLQANNMTIGDAVSGNGSATFDFGDSRHSSSVSLVSVMRIFHPY